MIFSSSISTVDNTAKSGDGDYQTLVALPLIFTVGGPNQKDVSVSVLEDVKIEATETFYVDMTSSDPKILFPSGKRAMINILNDDRMLLFFYYTIILFYYNYCVLRENNKWRVFYINCIIRVFYVWVKHLTRSYW